MNGDDDTAYPHVAVAGARKIAAGEADRGIFVCGTGMGVAISANKVPGIRAALAWSIATAELARQHNDAQVVALGGRQHTREEGLEIVLAFLDEPFSGDERHSRRIAQIGEFERTGTVAGRLDQVTARPHRG